MQRSQELDAAKEQLEQDLFTCRQSLQQQCDNHSKVGGTRLHTHLRKCVIWPSFSLLQLSEEHEVIQNRCQQLQEELSTAKQQTTLLQEMLAEKEREVEVRLFEGFEVDGQLEEISVGVSCADPATVCSSAQ